ncbi:hypothetical protein [Actinomadura hibisca]|uniref:hypothetical protein n=1 Tax=Actinomadura hibisca TaxID=68565 RepID=UPI0012F73417|nr:hypothetical protein [Actinomadura hibisca]
MTQDDTIKWLLDRSQRRNRTVPLRRSLVQDAVEDGPRSTSKPGPLTGLMRNESALDLLLLVHAVTTGGDFGVTERSETWARATGVSFATDGSASAPVSRLWQKLERLNLITRSQDGRLTRVTKLREDGTKRPYTRPTAAGYSALDEIYFQLPFQYWEDGYHHRLTIVGKAVMLIGMSLRKAQFALPQTTAFASYYGISKSTLERGVKELTDTGLINMTGTQTYETGETRTGYGERTLYGFCPPFDLNVRKHHPKDPAPKSQGSQHTAKASSSEASTPKPSVPVPQAETILNGLRQEPVGTADIFLLPAQVTTADERR